MDLETTVSVMRRLGIVHLKQSSSEHSIEILLGPDPFRASSAGAMYGNSTGAGDALRPPEEREPTDDEVLFASSQGWPDLTKTAG